MNERKPWRKLYTATASATGIFYLLWLLSMQTVLGPADAEASPMSEDTASSALAMLFAASLLLALGVPAVRSHATLARAFASVGSAILAKQLGVALLEMVRLGTSTGAGLAGAAVVVAPALFVLVSTFFADAPKPALGPATAKKQAA